MGEVLSVLVDVRDTGVRRGKLQGVDFVIARRAIFPTKQSRTLYIEIASGEEQERPRNDVKIQKDAG